MYCTSQVIIFFDSKYSEGTVADGYFLTKSEAPAVYLIRRSCPGFTKPVHVTFSKFVCGDGSDFT